MPLKGFGFVEGLLQIASRGIMEALAEQQREQDRDRERERERERARQRQALLVLAQTMEEEEEEEKRKYPVIVVGCGASGVACLSKLAESGVEAVGFEASSRMGGRICTEEFGANVVDLGAAWCHGEVNNLVFEQANPLNLLGRPGPVDPKHDEDWFVLSDGSLMPYGNAEAVYSSIQQAVNRCDKFNSTSIKEFIRTGVKSRSIETSPATIAITEPFLEWYERDNHLGGETDPRKGKSLRGLTKHEPCDGEFWLNWKGKGYKTILDVLLRKYPGSPGELKVNIQYGKEVSNILWTNPNPDPKDPVPTVLVTCADGTVTKASRVVVTVPLGVLKAKYLTMFTPPLPADKINTINNLQFCVLDKIYIHFESRWWPEGLSNFRILWREEDKAKFGADEKWVTGIYGLRVVEHQPKVLLAWLYGEQAEAMERVDLGSVKAGVNKLLDIFKINFDVTPVTEIKRSQWATNPLARGSYSYRAVTSEESQASAEVLSEPLTFASAPVVCFAGEASSHRWHNAVHGALDAGFREAKRVIESVQAAK